MKNKAFFIDRDGIICKMITKEGGYTDSPQSEDQVELFPGIVPLLSWLRAKNIPIIEVSNQPGAALGKMTMNNLENIERKVHTLLKNASVKVDHVYRCFHHPNATIEFYKEDCSCRKPKPGLLHKAGHDLSINLKESIFLGDNLTDIQAGFEVGCSTILFPHTPHRNDTKEKLQSDKAYQKTYLVNSLEEVPDVVAKIWPTI